LGSLREAQAQGRRPIYPFNENVGLSPFAFRLSLRLEEAARLILRHEWSLTDIATIVGFSDLSAFSRAFRKKFGVPPGKYGA
jgi:AraC-like DNA-binding protein